MEPFGDALELGGLGVGAEHVRGLLGDARLVLDLAVGRVDGAGRLAQRLGDRAERVGIAVGQAHAGEHVRAEVARRDVAELAREPALADARVADQQHEVRALARRRHLGEAAERRRARRRGRRAARAPAHPPAAGRARAPRPRGTRTTGSSRPCSVTAPSGS